MVVFKGLDLGGRDEGGFLRLEGEVDAVSDLVGTVGDPLLVLFDFSFAKGAGDLLSGFGVVLGKDEPGGASFLGSFGRGLCHRSPRVGRSFGGLGGRRLRIFVLR